MRHQRPFIRSMLIGLLPLLLSAGCSETGTEDPSLIDAIDSEFSDLDVSGGADADVMGVDVAEIDAAQDDAAAGLDPENTSAIDLPAAQFNYAIIKTPAHFEVETEHFHQQQPLSTSDNTPADNATTDEGATLGRVLFYDPNLSANRTVSCSSCHVAEHGFSDDRVLSIGFEGGETGRHSMGLTNARYYIGGQFFWDQRAETLEAQVLMPFQDPVEMGMTLETLIERAEGAAYYPDLFEAAFGSTEITSDRISKALAQFVRSMVSVNSRYDKGRAQVSARSADFPNFTAQENLGKRLFSKPPPQGGLGCFVCHQGEGMVPAMATTNGLDAAITDQGYGAVTGLAGHDGTFKVPSLRNIELTAPYMHDGRFASLEHVMDHYSEGVQASPNLTGPLSASFQIKMTDAEKAAVIAFLRTLTDKTLVEDPKFSDPFVQ